VQRFVVGRVVFNVGAILKVRLWVKLIEQVDKHFDFRFNNLARNFSQRYAIRKISYVGLQSGCVVRIQGVELFRGLIELGLRGKR
jgi:hypothetical protein